MDEGTGSQSFPVVANSDSTASRAHFHSFTLNDDGGTSSQKAGFSDSVLIENNGSKTSLYPAYGLLMTGYQENDTFLMLPGHGEAKHNCGEIRHGYRCSNSSCEDHKHLHLHHENCGRFMCPVCHSKNEQRKATDAVERMEGMKQSYEATGVKFGPLDHVELSPPPGRYVLKDVSTKKGYQKIHRDAEKILKKYVYKEAGVLIFHPWRFKHLDGSTCEKEDCKEKHKPVFSPHFHYCGYGYWKKADEFYQLTEGWVYKKISPGKARNAFATISYELSHCGILIEAKPIYDSVSHARIQGTMDLKQCGEVVRYVGLFSKSRGGFIVESKTWDVQICEKCSSEIHDYDLDLDLNNRLVPFRDIGPHLIFNIQGSWKLTEPKKKKQRKVDKIYLEKPQEWSIKNDDAS